MLAGTVDRNEYRRAKLKRKKEARGVESKFDSMSKSNNTVGKDLRI
jgi:hypothetical protein